MAKYTAKQGVIDPQQIYSFQAFSKLTGVGASGIREAKRNGLQVRYNGRGGWILGQWWIDYIVTNGKPSRSAR
ncbi:hypothetical protein OAU93_01685 [bacterium]|nr:hypothetical protein [bacterium]